jgi:hypothetical protein
MATLSRLPPEPSRSPGEIREYEGRVWDLTRHLIHPAFLYVVFQVTLWCALERNPGFRGESLSFWDRSLIHALQFVGAWGVFYGTLLRDMRFQTRVVTVVLWLAAAGTAAAWLWPAPESADTGRAFWILLLIELGAGILGWVLIMSAWMRAKARHHARSAGASEPRSAGRSKRSEDYLHD